MSSPQTFWTRIFSYSSHSDQGLARSLSGCQQMECYIIDPRPKPVAASRVRRQFRGVLSKDSPMHGSAVVRWAVYYHPTKTVVSSTAPWRPKLDICRIVVGTLEAHY
jgi:hypothetical protein